MKNETANFIYDQQIADSCKKLNSTQVFSILYDRFQDMLDCIIIYHPELEKIAVKKLHRYFSIKDRYYRLAKWYLKFGCPKFLQWLVQMSYNRCVSVMRDTVIYFETYSEQSNVYNEIFTYERVLWEKREKETFGKQIFTPDWKLIKEN